jgi:hypothetical protein
MSAKSSSYPVRLNADETIRSRDLIHSSQRLLVVSPVGRIIRGFHFREPLDADGVDLGDPVLEVGPFDLFLYVAIAQNAFQCDGCFF